MSETTVRRRGHGEDGIYLDAARNRYVGAISLGYGPDGKRIRRKVSGKTKQEVRAKLKELRDHLTKNADYVGQKFPEEARKMHYGEIDHRSIYGEASPKEAKELYDEGVEFHPLPVLPEERN